MLSTIRNNIIFKVFCVIIGLHILNICVDTPDKYSEDIPENLSINDQESIIEMFFELVLQLEDTFVEYDDYDGDNNQNKKRSFSTDYFLVDILHFNTNFQLKSINSSTLTERICHLAKEPIIPPPKV